MLALWDISLFVSLIIKFTIVFVTRLINFVGNVVPFQLQRCQIFYTAGKYDRSGFIVGIVKKDSFIDGKPLWLEMYSLAYHLVESIQWLLSCKKEGHNYYLMLKFA